MRALAGPISRIFFDDGFDFLLNLLEIFQSPIYVVSPQIFFIFATAMGFYDDFHITLEPLRLTP